MENKFNDYNNDNNVYGSMEGAQDNQAIDFQEQGMDKTDNNQRVYVTGSYGEAQPDFLNQPGMANQADLSQPETAGQTYARTQGQSDAAALAYPKTQEQSNADALAYPGAQEQSDADVLAYARAQEQQNAVGQGYEAQPETVSQNWADGQIGSQNYIQGQSYVEGAQGQGYTKEMQESQQGYAQGAQGSQGQGHAEGARGSKEQVPGASDQKFYHAQGAAEKKKKKKSSGGKKPHGFGVSLAKCAALAVVFGLVSSTVFYGTGLAFEYTSGKSGAQLTAESGNSNKVTVNNGDLSATNVSTATTVTDVSDIVDNVMPSIVSITNMGQIEGDFFGRTYRQDTSSAGSGIIIGQTEDEIYIATNNHVVANSNQLTVNFIDDQQVTAEIKGTDSSTDLAVLAVKVKDIPSETMSEIKVATLGNSDDIKVGQSVVAIGNALGYGQSVTTGVISALNREVTVQDETTGAAITNELLQTDAAINPGNSGGALLNMNGELIGINSVKYSDTQVEGMGYSIPISAAEPIINDLITRQLVDESESAFFGVSGQDVNSQISESFGMPEGLYITRVSENSAAEQAGVKKGDVLTKFEGRAVKSMEGLQEIMQYYAAGTEVEVTLQINENGEWKERVVTVTLGRKNN